MNHEERQNLIKDAAARGRSTQAQRAIERAKAHVQDCPICGQLIPYEKRRNKFCSRSCARVETNSTRSQERWCLMCNDRLRKSQKRYCSRKCQLDKQHHDYITQWKLGLEPGGNDYGISPYVRRYLYETRGENCERCGWKEIREKDGRVPLTIHHKGRYNDHREEMLEILCPNHHALTETYGALNKGYGRTYRYA